jgi:hypothetical protein
MFKKELQLQTKANWKQLILHKCQALQKAAKQALLINNFLQVVIPLHSKRV